MMQMKEKKETTTMGGDDVLPVQVDDSHTGCTSQAIDIVGGGGAADAVTKTVSLGTHPPESNPLTVVTTVAKPTLQCRTTSASDALVAVPIWTSEDEATLNEHDGPEPGGESPMVDVCKSYSNATNGYFRNVNPTRSDPSRRPVIALPAPPTHPPINGDHSHSYLQTTTAADDKQLTPISTSCTTTTRPLTDGIVMPVSTCDSRRTDVSCLQNSTAQNDSSDKVEGATADRLMENGDCISTVDSSSEKENEGSIESLHQVVEQAEARCLCQCSSAPAPLRLMSQGEQSDSADTIVYELAGKDHDHNQPLSIEDLRHHSQNQYRRMQSEGGVLMFASMDSLPAPDIYNVDGSQEYSGVDPISPVNDMQAMMRRRTTSQTLASPAGRIGLFDDPGGSASISERPYTKQSQTEQVIMMHTLKTKLSKYQSFVDKAFQLIGRGQDETIIEGCTILTKVMTKAWVFPKISHDLAYGLCDYLRDMQYFELLLRLFIKNNTPLDVRLACGRVLEECFSLQNRDYVVNKQYLKKLVVTAERFSTTPEQQRMSISLMESLFKQSSATSLSLIELGALDHILLACKQSIETPTTLRHAALALANLSLYSCDEGKKKLIQKKVPDWLFLLASQADEITRYYACLAVCMLASIKEIEAAVIKSGTLQLVEPFLNSHSPENFVNADYKHSQGRPKEWLSRLLPMLSSKCSEAKSLCAFHFVMEAIIKRDQHKLDIFQEIGAVKALQEVASSPDEIAAKYASAALTITGQEVPYKLTQKVPSWSIPDVQYWVRKIGFESYAERFAEHMVDGDLLLLITEFELEKDIGMTSKLLRKRFMRELESLKIAADYGSVDESLLDQFLMSLSPELSVYTYQMLQIGLNRALLPSLTDEMMKTVCNMSNPIHRLKLRQALQDSKHIDDIEVAILSKQIDVFISYRRSTGNQLASLIKVLLQLRGYKVFIDVDKLYAGKFDSSLLKNIQAAKHFILVLTPNSLDRLLGDTACEDWVHKEIKCAFEHQKNIIPIYDQHFAFPANENDLPQDIRHITRYNGVRWVHEYQEACVDKVERFLKDELNRHPLGQPQGSHRKSAPINRWNQPAVGSSRLPSSGAKVSVSRQLDNENRKKLRGSYNNVSGPSPS